MKQALHIFAFNEYHNHTDNSEDFYEAILNLKNQRERAKKLGFQLDNTLSTNKVKKYSFIYFTWGMDMDKYIEKNKNEQISLRNFCLSSINKEDKKREVKKKI